MVIKKEDLLDKDLMGIAKMKNIRSKFEVDVLDGTIKNNNFLKNF